MPDWTWYYSNGDSDYFTFTLPYDAQQRYEELLQEHEQQDRMMEQMIREEAERIEDRKKYPLFFLKEGIV